MMRPLKSCSLVAVCVSMPAAAQLGSLLNAGNPLNATVPTTSYTVDLVDVIRIPNSSGSTRPRLDAMTYAPDGSGKLFVTDQRGRVYSFRPGDVTPQLVLSPNMLPSFLDGNETGLQGVALHPDFGNVGTAGFRKMYVSWSSSATTGSANTPTFAYNKSAAHHHSVLTEFTLNANGTADAASARQLMRVVQPFSNHNIGEVRFNPNSAPGDADYGMLYVALGDGGSGYDPNNDAQDRSNPLGSILRIEPTTPANGKQYSVPSSNPFVGQSGVLAETWAYGLRNAQTFNWDTGPGGKMLIADIGQNNIEEINLGQAGANYGWKQREGTFDAQNRSGNQLRFLPANHTTDTLTYPVIQYDHDFNNDNVEDPGVSVSGGGVYRDNALANLEGKYIFADFSNGNGGPIYVVAADDIIQREDFTNLAALNNGRLAPYEQLRLRYNGSEQSFLQTIRNASGNASLSRTDTRFGDDDRGGIFLLNKHDGFVRKLLPSAPVAGDFDLTADLTARDIDWLFQAFGSVTPNTDRFDLNNDNTVNATDANLWVNVIAGTQFGDTDLDGDVDGFDAATLRLNFTGRIDATNTAGNPNAPSWAKGNTDGDADIDFADAARLRINFAFSEPELALLNLTPDAASALSETQWATAIDTLAIAYGLVVPEPVGLALLAPLAMLRRRPPASNDE